jgi:hypothetical protein
MKRVRLFGFTLFLLGGGLVGSMVDEMLVKLGLAWVFG